MLLNAKPWAIILFTNTNRLGFEITATGHFYFRNNETDDMLVHQNSAEGVDLLSCANTFFAHWAIMSARFLNADFEFKIDNLIIRFSLQ